jgi:asparagine synthase (glutamine-hydrolysing)
MCGICGKYSQVGVRPQEVWGMLQAIAHRGPDDKGVYVKGDIGIGNCRLSIIDLPGGHQPICNEDETVWIVYNGEIYNYRQLRHDLEAKGHIFRTQSDTEVIVHLYEDLGERCVERLSGMFAFALWDATAQKLVLARDRIGQKPLFYMQDGNDFLFASEAKAILAAMQRPREIDDEALHHYLSLRFIPPPHTMFRDIRKLPPAHILVYQGGRITVSRYWSLSFRQKLELPEEELMEELRGELTRAVTSHLVGDVPLGAFLSGGMDSSMIVAMMAGEVGRSFKTFAIGVQEQDFDELPYARLVADRYQTKHVEERVQAKLIHSLPKMIWHLDEPSDPIAACQYYAAELASRHVKVVLGGDGGDELFAGFDRYLGVGRVNSYARIPSLIRRKVLGPAAARMPDSFTYKSLTQKFRWVHQLSQLPTMAERYAEATCFFRFNHRDKQMLYGDDLWARVRDTNSADVIVRAFEDAEAIDPLDRMIGADFVTRLPEHSLMLTDRMTMAHGLEARSPYLDHELVEFMAGVPSHLKIRHGRLKHVLRKVAEDYLPEQIVRRGKQGFMLPIAYWFRSELLPLVEGMLLDSHFVKTGLFRHDSVSRLIAEHRSGRLDNHVRLWMLLTLEVWHQIYIEQRSLESVNRGILSYLSGLQTCRESL